MTTRIVLESMPTETQFTPLAVLGYCLTRTGFLQPVWSGLDLNMRTRDHAPWEKLQDVLVSVLAGCKSIHQINLKLRPDQALATAWARVTFAEQATVSRTLEAFDGEALAQLRSGSQHLFHLHSQTVQHDFGATWLVMDIDETRLLASKRAEGSRKGFAIGKKINAAG